MTVQRDISDRFEDEEIAHAYADEFLNMSIATQVRVLREERILTQEQLGNLAGMKQERISVLENVNYSSWSINSLRKLAKAFDVRLKVSFETFGSLIADMNNFNRGALERISRNEERRLTKKAAADVKDGKIFTIPGPNPKIGMEEESTNPYGILKGAAAINWESMPPKVNMPPLASLPSR
jgi:transcriptional regulator with XRE-family HTH domain